MSTIESEPLLSPASSSSSLLEETRSHNNSDTTTASQPQPQQEQPLLVQPQVATATTSLLSSSSSQSQAAPVPRQSLKRSTSLARLFTIGAPAGVSSQRSSSSNSNSNNTPMPLRAIAQRAASWRLNSSSSSSSSTTNQPRNHNNNNTNQHNSNNHMPWNRFRRSSTTSTSSSNTTTTSTAPASSSLKPPPAADATEFMDGSLSDEELVLFEVMSGQQQNVLHFLQSGDCPADVVPHILAFCGPQVASKLAHVNKFWHRTLASEATWSVLCQDLYKWKPGDKEPTSWKQYYRENPCVPVDYKTVHSALEACPGDNVTVWLRPGRYYLKHGLDFNRSTTSKVALQTMKMPSNLYQPPPSALEHLSHGGALAQPRRKKRRGSRLLQQFISCLSASQHDDDDDMDMEESESEAELSIGSSILAATMDQSSAASSSSSSAFLSVPPSPTRATLVLRTRRMNEPLIRVQRGHFSATNINLEHSSHGLDIWNGNAAIQVQPPPRPQPPQGGAALPPIPRSELPVAYLSGLRVSSRSGRGVVTIDGGQLVLKQSRVHECAATGVYIGGRGTTRAVLVETDVVRNGLGSTAQHRATNHRRNGGRDNNNVGIARGHSGIYLEKGAAHILDCNVSHNTLTGVTAVSTEQSLLRVSHTDLVANGTFQLEVPQQAATAGVTLQDNRLEATGTGRVRAALAATH